VSCALDADSNTLKSLATAIAERPGHAAVFVSTSRPSLIVVARAVDVPVSAQQILSSLMQRFGGRGGGKAELAQGGGLDAASDTILAAVRESIAASSTNP
jgi:alanyl-tRNA synthetase